MTLRERALCFRERRRKFREAGLCHHCGRERLLDSTHCARCYLQKKRRSKEYYMKHRLETIKRVEARRQVNRREKKCLSCGVPLFEEESILCMACRIKDNERHK